MKNEGPYLREWLEFHKIVGVERFYLYNNNSTDNTKDIVRPYVDTGEVILKYWPEKVGQQKKAYTDFLENNKNESEWVAFIDLDEFLFPTVDHDLKKVLKEFVDYPAVGINWLIFGSSGHETKPEGLQIENYTYRAENEFGANLNFKSIVRSNQTISCIGPHHFTYANNGVAVTEKLEPLRGKTTEKHSVTKLRINHYFTRSKEETKNKIKRGRATVKSKRKLSFVLLHDRNDVQDLTIQRFLPNLKKELDKINKSYPLLESNSESVDLSRPLIPKSSQSKEIVPIQGNINKLIIKNKNLLLVGWVASINSGPVNGFKVVIGDKEVTEFNLTLGLPSPGVKKAYPYLSNNFLAKFRLQLPWNQKQQIARDLLIRLTPLFNNCEGGLILAIQDSSISTPSKEYINNFGGVNSKEFIATGFKWLSYLIQRVELKPTDHILDIGCGFGKIAYALTSYLEPPGRYEGFDIAKTHLEWLQQEISTCKPNFNFRFVDVYHPIYHPEGNVPLTEFVFPYPDESFDLVCLRDIFTHLQADAVGQYLREINRVLKPRGKCLLSCFLLNFESEGLTTKGKSSKKFVHQLQDCFTTNPKKPEVSIGYQESYLKQLIMEQDLNAIAKYYGSWCGRVSFTKPDLVILQKNSTGETMENKTQESIVESHSQLEHMKKLLNHYQQKLQKIQK
ncbi:MAG: glycosyltransferase family 92 protein [Trichodesmium sp. MAG_R03]|nr:glycosyltransferase family 92 protein [Trichodesmium sp. MAG_R03]